MKLIPLLLLLASLIASSRTEARPQATLHSTAIGASEPVVSLHLAAPRGAPDVGSWTASDRQALLGAPHERDALALRVPGGVDRRPLAMTAAPLSGTATWFCGGGSPCTRGYTPADYIAAVDPGLGIPRGTLLTVRHGDRAVLVRAVDVCQCAGRRIIDLSRIAFSRLASPSAGVISVTVSGASLPQTDTVP